MNSQNSGNNRIDYFQNATLRSALACPGWAVVCKIGLKLFWRTLYGKMNCKFEISGHFLLWIINLLFANLQSLQNWFAKLKGHNMLYITFWNKPYLPMQSFDNHDNDFSHFSQLLIWGVKIFNSKEIDFRKKQIDLLF